MHIEQLIEAVARDQYLMSTSTDTTRCEPRMATIVDAKPLSDSWLAVSPAGCYSAPVSWCAEISYEVYYTVAAHKPMLAEQSAGMLVFLGTMCKKSVSNEVGSND